MIRTLLIVLGVGLGTYLIRAVSLSLGSRVRWPDWIRAWLGYVTPAVLGAMLGPMLLLPDGAMLSPWRNPALLASVPTGLVAWRTKNLLWTVACGVVCYAVIAR
ncbi:AzlD domain-containing protein [Alicyclobacillus sp.]|uniref:AzlD domain-containing protein n=1 Tax=Alicyclobacillus sp. TaxID=61169 RepID=UPI0025C2A738|nr:AzlD domain-containing protein [Alicyclobacillus sp.]MCL6517075.1 AzlD domain-containing protein [Alicyclobacillus sp.]